MKITKYLILLFAAIMLNSNAQAQDQEYGVFLGSSAYRGDLDQTPFAGRGLRLAVGGIYKYHFTPKLAFKAGLNFTYLGGYDHRNYDINSTDLTEKSLATRNLTFYTHLIELSGQLEYSFLNYVPGSKKYNFTPYVFGGVGLINFNPKANIAGTVYTLKDYETEPGKSYSTTQIVIPIGLGIKKTFGKDNMWNIGLQAGWRMTFTDYLDDASSKAPLTFTDATTRLLALRNYTNGKNNQPGMIRGNPNNNDAYFMVGFTISKTIRKYECAKID